MGSAAPFCRSYLTVQMTRLHSRQALENTGFEIGLCTVHGRMYNIIGIIQSIGKLTRLPLSFGFIQL